MAVLMETSLGDLEIDLYTEECPQESMNFLKLCKCKYYNFSLFHRVVRNFVAQTGDPTGRGSGGESVWGLMKGEQFRFFKRNEDNKFKHVKRGTLSLVNDGANRHGSQFFITLGENLDSLDGKHSVFGEVAEESYPVLDKINSAMCDEKNQPYRDIRIRHTIILDDPFEDPPGLPVPPQSPLPTQEQLEAGLIGEDEEINEFEGMDEEDVEEIMRKREARGRAQVLEMVGDLPDADIKAPENVLFVCKLNPVTTDEDLRLIFSRFGRILSCEIIRDWKTQESLQYAFIEFETKEACEEAYLKMENVLIDDRRIHVDFSQSVAKLKDYHLPGGWKMRGADKKGKGKQGQGKGDSQQGPSEPRPPKYALAFKGDKGDAGAARGSGDRDAAERRGRKRRSRWDTAGGGDVRKESSSNSSSRKGRDEGTGDKRADADDAGDGAVVEERGRRGRDRSRSRSRERHRHRRHRSRSRSRSRSRRDKRHRRDRDRGRESDRDRDRRPRRHRDRSAERRGSDDRRHRR